MSRTPWWMGPAAHGTEARAMWHRRKGLGGKTLRQVCASCADAETRARTARANAKGSWGSRPITGRSRGYRRG